MSANLRLTETIADVYEKGAIDSGKLGQQMEKFEDKMIKIRHDVKD